MSHRRVVLAMLFGLCATMCSMALAAPNSGDHATASTASAIRTTLQADLTFKSTLAPELLPIAALHQKTCRCSCGFPCNQDDDCGPGGSCEQFISCCDRNQTSQAFQQSAARSTRKGEMPAVTLNVQCK